MNIAIACDHAALNLKATIVAHLENTGHKVTDCGAFSTAAVDYPDYAEAASRVVLSGKAELGILICGTGIGMSMAANKIDGIRCAVVSDTFSAKATRAHNDANMMAIGERVTGAGLALELVDAFIGTPFSNDERHVRRIAKITALEK